MPCFPDKAPKEKKKRVPSIVLEDAPTTSKAKQIWTIQVFFNF